MYGSIASKLDACKKKAVTRGIAFIGLDDRKCWTGANASSAFSMYGTSGQCKHNRKNTASMGYFASETIFVYRKNNNDVWEQLGCYSNKSPTNALPDSFANVSSVSGADAIYEYCKEKAETLGYTMFGADEKNCWSDDDAENNYDKYGESKLCKFSKKGTGNAHGEDKYGNVFVYKMG